MRVAAILQAAGLGRAEMPTRIAGSTNEVWRADDVIVRVSLVPGSNRLRREAELSKVLPSSVQYPKVIATGDEEFGEWVISRHRAGVPLSQAWPSLDEAERRDAVHQLAESLAVVHSLQLPEGGEGRAGIDAIDDDPLVPHQLRPERLDAILDAATRNPHVDRGLVREARARLHEVAGAMSTRPDVLVHGDVHFENVLVVDGVVVALLDFEWARLAPAELDIDVLARFCADPALHLGGDYAVDKDDYVDVLRWFREAYPSLFAHELLRERLLGCALAFEIPWLLKAPPTEPMATLPRFHPAWQLRRLLDEGSHAERLGWGDVPAFRLQNRPRH